MRTCRARRRKSSPRPRRSARGRDASGFYGTFRINVDWITAVNAHQAARPRPTSRLRRATACRSGWRFRGSARPGSKAGTGRRKRSSNWGRDGPLRAVGGVSRTHLALRQPIDLSLISALGRFDDAQDSIGCSASSTRRSFPEPWSPPASAISRTGKPKRRLDHAAGRDPPRIRPHVPGLAPEAVAGLRLHSRGARRNPGAESV